MKRPIALVDLDDTLFQTLRKCPAEIGQEALIPLGFAVDGSPLSYATPRQMAFLDWLRETAVLVPVTGRSIDALRRVAIDFSAAVCAHGGVILDGERRPDPDWAARMREESASHSETLAALAASLRRAAAGIPLSVRILREMDFDLYIVVKHPEADETLLNAVVDTVAHEVPPGWTLHRNGNNVAVMPPFLGKANAVAALLPRLRALHGDVPVIGIGDSITDAPFLRLCDHAMMPAGSQLADAALAPLS